MKLTAQDPHTPKNYGFGKSAVAQDERVRMASCISTLLGDLMEAVTHRMPQERTDCAPPFVFKYG